MANFFRTLRQRRETPFLDTLNTSTEGKIEVVSSPESPLRRLDHRLSRNRFSRREKRHSENSDGESPSTEKDEMPSSPSTESPTPSRRKRAQTTLERMGVQISSRLQKANPLDLTPVDPAQKETTPDPLPEDDSPLPDQPPQPSEDWLRNFHKEKDRYQFVWWGGRIRSPTDFPHAELGGFPVRQVALGGRHFLLLTENGKVYSWGDGSSGQLGHGDMQEQSSPTLVKALDGLIVLQVFCSAAQSAALTNTGHLYTWGWNGSREMKNLPSVVEELRGPRILQVALGAYHSAALLAPSDDNEATHGRVHTWGCGTKGQLGLGDLEDQAVPVLVPGLADVDISYIACGETYMAAIATDGRLFVWGNNEKGILGVEQYQDALSCPTLVESLSEVTNVGCGLSSLAAVTQDGSVYTWGRNSEGQLGHGTEGGYILTPRRVRKLAGERVVGVSADNNYMIAWTEHGKTYAWGSNRNNRLGLNCDHPFVSLPTVIEPLNGQVPLEISCRSRVIVACVGKRLFEVPLRDTLEEDEEIPGVIKESVEFLLHHVHREGLFRVAPSEVCKQQLIAWWNAGYYVNMSESDDPHIVGTLFKYFLRCLPEPLMTFDLYSQLMSVQEDPQDCLHRLESLRTVLRKLPMENRRLLGIVLHLLSRVDNARETSLMGAKNLASIFAPSFFRPPPSEVEFVHDLSRQIKLTKKMIKYFPGVLSANSTDMLTHACRVLVDETCTREEIAKEQRRHWLVWAKNLMDPSASFVQADGSAGTFTQIFFESAALNYSIQSAILQFPSPDAMGHFEQLLSLLSDVPSSTAITLIEGFHYIKLPASERAYFGAALASFKDLSNLTDVPSSTVDWLATPLTAYPIEDDELKQQLQATERSALALRQSEQERNMGEHASADDESGEKTALPAPTEIISFMSKQRDRYQEEISNMRRDKEESEEGRQVLDPKHQQLQEGLDTLETERAALQKQLDEKNQELHEIENKLSEYARESSLEHQRYKNEMEEMDSLMEAKQQALDLFTTAEGTFQTFLRGPFDSNHRRLMKMRSDLEESILANTSECPLLLRQYLTATQSTFSALRKRMKRIKKDKKRIEKSYGDAAAQAIQCEYVKCMELVQEMLVEYEEAVNIYRPILRPVHNWILFCESSGIQPNQSEALGDFIVQSRLQPTNITRQFLHRLFECFGLFTPPSEQLNLFQEVLKSSASIDDHISAITRRHNIGVQE